MTDADPHPPEPVTVLDHADRYTTAGIRVLPIRPGGKHPPMTSWQHAATVDPKTCRNWWNGLYRDAGIGLAMGRQPDGRRLFALDVDEHDPAISGSDTLAELEAIHGRLPDTVRAITGSGGAHLIFDSGDVEVTNGAAGQVGPGLDIRGEGGQIVVAPTIHPNGTPYQWEDGCAPWERAVAAAPAWLLTMVGPEISEGVDESTSSVARTSRRTATPPPSTPADVLRHSWDWQAELTNRGWQLSKRDRNGDTHWTRPGKDPREGTSGVLHGDDGPFVVFTTTGTEAMWRAGKVGRGCVSLSPLAYLAAYDHGGSLSDAATALRAANAGTVDPTVTVLHQPEDDPRNILIHWPEFWSKDHGDAEWLAEPILPAKRSVAIFAPGGTGKSLLALWLAVRLATGGTIFGRPVEAVNVLYLDYEMTADDLAERLESMGYGADTDLSRLHYALLPSLPGLDQEEGGKAVVELARLVDAQLVVIDTFGRAVHGDENEADTVRAWYRWTGLHLKAEDRAFVRVDHAGKDLEKGQRGTSAKNDDVDIVWRLTPQDAGAFRLVAKKRRMGWVPEKVEIALRDEPMLEYVMAEAQPYPTGTKALAERLDALGVPVNASGREAERALKAAGEGKRGVLVRAAQRWRLEAVPAFGNDGTHLGTHPSPRPRDAPRDAPEAESANPLVDELGRTSGRTGTHPASTHGTQCVPLRGTHAPSASPDPDDEPKEDLF